MNIEFRCATCGQLLRVPGEAAGKMARCPMCQTEQVVLPPAPAAVPSLEENPYAPPLAVPPPVTGAAAARQPLIPTPLKVGECFSAAWNIYLANVGMCIAVYLAGEFISQAPGMFIQMLAAVVEEARGGVEIVFLMLVMPVLIAGIVLSLWLTAGRMSFFVKTARGVSPEFVELFKGWRSVVRFFLLGLMLTAAGMGLFFVGGLVVALVAAIVGGAGADELVVVILIPLLIIGIGTYIYLLLRYGMSFYLVVDRDLTVGDALRTSAKITAGNVMSLFVLAMLNGLLAIAGYLACCVGIFFTLPLTSMIFTVAYLQMSGQTLATTATRG